MSKPLNKGLFAVRRTLILFFVVLPFSLFSQSYENKEALMYDFFDKGYEQVYINRDSAYFNLEKALDVAIEIEDYDSQLGILDHIVICSDYHYDLKKYQETLHKIELRLKNDAIASVIQDYQGWQVSFQSNTGGYYFKTKEYSKAKSTFLDIRSRFDSIRPDDLTAAQADYLNSANSYLGTIYKHLGKYNLSEQYYLKNIALIKASPVLAKDARAFIIGEQRLLAQLYALTGKFAEAGNYYKEALEWGQENYRKDKIYKNHLLSTFQKATQNYIAQDSLKKALEYLDKSQEYLIEDDPFHKDALVLYGDIYSGLNDDDSALKSYQKALQAFTEYRQKRPHQDIAEVLGKIATFHLKRENYSEGLETIQNALINAGNKIEFEGYLKNPNANEVFSKRQLLQLLDTKLQLLQIAYSKTADQKYNEVSIRTNNDILSTFDLLKKEFDNKLDKQFLAETAYPIFHRMLAITYEVYEESSNRELFELALNISEKNKDFLLLEALRNANANQYGNIPKKVLEKEAQLRAKISNLEKNIFDMTENESVYSEELFEMKQEYYGFLDTLESKYPKYHDLKYQSKSLNLVDFRTALENDGAMLSFTMSSDHLYVLVFDGKAEDFLKLPFDESDRASVREFYKLISSPVMKDNDQAISELASKLYDKILKASLKNFENENLTIIADDVLHYLPFDLLVNDDEFLLRSKLIGYGNSISSYLQLKQKGNEVAESLLAFAPTFDDQIDGSEIRLEFGKLLYNDDEVKKVGSAFDAEILIDNEATLQNFNKRAPQFGLIHLATHASANDAYPDYSYLAFTEMKDGGGANRLYIKDLYNISLNAEMVTLSACQTGIGKLQKGQGMMSLSKGFFYAGAKSLVNTLWRINDKSSVKLMEFFYEALSQGKSKKEALRDAKLKYLATTDDNLLKHPYYWSAFVVSGDPSAIVETDYSWYIGSCVLFFLVLIIFSSAKENRAEVIKLRKF